MCRFPILDLRTGPIEKPWWLKRLRHEKLIVELTNATVQTTLGDNTDELDIDLICQEAHGRTGNQDLTAKGLLLTSMVRE